MTFAPESLKNLAAYWEAQGGVNLGIVGDASHVTKGTSYHLGKDLLLPGAYSVVLPRDKAGLSDAASAIDLGKLNGSYPELRRFSEWLVSEALAGKCPDIREIIYCSADGKEIRRWSGPDNKVYVSMRKTPGGWVVVTPGNGDASHEFHTHESYYRDSENRDKTAAFRPYFEGDDMRGLIVGADRVLGDVPTGTPYYDQPNGKQIGTTGGTFEWHGSPTLDDGVTRDPAWAMIVGLDKDLKRVPGVARYIRRPALLNLRGFPAADCSAWETWYAEAPGH